MRGTILIFKKELVQMFKNTSLLAHLIFILAFSVAFPQVFAHSMISRESITLEKVLALIEIGKYYPLMMGVLFAAILAGESFAGERERKTIEVLAATPLGERSIFLGKFLFSVFVALMLELPTFASFTQAIYLLIKAGGFAIDFMSSGYLLTCTALSWSLTLLVAMLVVIASLYVRTKASATASSFSVLLPIALLISGAALFNITVDNTLLISISLIAIAISSAMLLLLFRHMDKELMILGLVRG